MTNATKKRITAKERYEAEKRTTKPISFNKVEHAKLLDLIANFTFGVWVKTLLSHFKASEINLVKDDMNFVPSSLVQHAIENGYFDLDEYLESKGKKIVDNVKLQARASNSDMMHHDVDEFNQEYYNSP